MRLNLADSTLGMGWSGQYAMDGQELVIQPADWNGEFSVGGETTVGFCASGHNNLTIQSASIE